MSRLVRFSVAALCGVLFTCLSGFCPHAVTAIQDDSITLQPIPATIYRTNDSTLFQIPIESFYFQVVVLDTQNRKLKPIHAKSSLYSGDQLMTVQEMGDKAIQSVATKRYGMPPNLKFDPLNPIHQYIKETSMPEAFDVAHVFRVRSDWKIDRVHYDLDLKDDGGQKFKKSIDIPVKIYEQKAKLIFPLKGDFILTVGSITENGHTTRSEMFAMDIISTTEQGAITKGDGSTNEDQIAWGREVVAPADGVVTYCRNDVPNQILNKFDEKLPGTVPDPVMAITGNSVIIDHGNNEFSLMAHMQKGSVRVKIGDHVKQGQVLGLVGSSGNALGPHLHYQFMNGPKYVSADGLPPTFSNVDGFVKRGVFLKAS